jgi:hypothetical protein
MGFGSNWGNRKKKNKRKSLTPKQKEEVLKKQNGKCTQCNKELYPAITHYDHIVPISEEDSTNDLHNIQALCGDCHTNKTKLENKQRGIRNKLKKNKNQNNEFDVLRGGGGSFESDFDVIGGNKSKKRKSKKKHDIIGDTDMIRRDFDINLK